MTFWKLRNSLIMLIRRKFKKLQHPLLQLLLQLALIFHLLHSPNLALKRPLNLFANLISDNYLNLLVQFVLVTEGECEWIDAKIYLRALLVVLIFQVPLDGFFDFSNFDCNVYHRVVANQICVQRYQLSVVLVQGLLSMLFNLSDAWLNNL